MKENRLIFIIPGNPGNPKLYKLMTEKLSSSCTDTVCVGHPSHFRQVNSTISPYFTLANIIIYHLEFLKIQIKQYSSITLVGHSIGAYICIQVLNNMTKLELRRIENFFMICPTIYRMKDTHADKKINVYKHIYPLVAKIGSLLPIHLLNKFVGIESGHELFDEEIVNNCLQLYLQDEAFEVYDFPNIKKCPKKTYVFCSPTDDWCPDFVMRKLKENFENISILNVKHDFIRYETEVDTVCEKILEKMS